MLVVMLAYSRKHSEQKTVYLVVTLCCNGFGFTKVMTPICVRPK